jgi:putative phosphoesterase
MKIGLISDTHGYLDPRIEKIFAGVDHILHAGDIGPVTAVLGNNDNSPSYRLSESVELGGKKFFVHHIVTPRELHSELQSRFNADKPYAVIFGHSHKKFHEFLNGVHFVNPGYAGKPRFNQPRSVALLELNGRGFRPQFIEL